MSINLNNIKDADIRDNFKSIQDNLNKNQILNAEFKIFDIEVTQAVTNHKIEHGLGYKPQDIIQTRIVGVGTVTYNYDSFDATYVDVTTSDACKFRFLVGTVNTKGGTII